MTTREAMAAAYQDLLADARRNISELQADLTEQQRINERLMRFVGFVRLWAHRQDPPNAVKKLTDEERLGVIKHHPMLNDNAACLAGLAREREEAALSAALARAEKAEAALAGARDAALEEAANWLEPDGPRPCDCDHCDCGNVGDQQRVAAWDEAKASASAIRHLASAARTVEPRHD